LLVRPQKLPAADSERVFRVALSREYRAMELLRRPEVDYRALMSLSDIGPGVDDPAVAEQVSIQCKYAGYIERQREEIQRQRRHETQALPGDLDYGKVAGLSSEVREKLARQRPLTLGQASRIPGVTPAAISLLLVHLKRRQYRQSA